MTGAPGLAGSVPLGEWEGDGVILPIIHRKSVEMLVDRGMPFVNVTAWPDVPSVGNDNAAIGQLGARHFLERGFRRFAFAGVPKAIYSRQRFEAYRNTLEAAGFAVEYVERESHFPNGWSLKADRQPLYDWLEGKTGPLAAMACNDNTASALMTVARELGRRIPEDLAVLGVDNEVTDDLLNPPLSSIIADGRRVGFLAAEMLHRRMDGKPLPQQTVLVPPKGVAERRSTDTLGFDDEDTARALRFIRQHPDRPINVNELLREVPMSRRTLERRFKKAVGHSPWREIRRVQIEHVKRMLLETDWPIKRLVLNSAFPSASRLIEVFRQETGETPVAYRSRHRLQ